MHVVKLCDFGSSKILVKGEGNASKICSLHYRAPELIFDATDYTVAIDTWSVGCVFAALLLGTPLFQGRCVPEQLVEIIKVRLMIELARSCRACDIHGSWSKMLLAS